MSGVLVGVGVLNEGLAAPAQNVYAVSVASGQNRKEIEHQTLAVQQQNGAGYVFENEQKFFQIYGVYDNFNVAENVKNTLQSDECEILTVEIAAQQVEGSFDKNEKQILQACLKLKMDCFLKLSDIAVSLDTAVMDAATARRQCSQVYSNAVATKANFNAYFSAAKLPVVEKMLQNCSQHLLALVSQTENSVPLSAQIKNCCCKILFE